MTLKEFVKKHRQEIDAAIDASNYRWNGHGGRGKVPVPAPKHNDQERRDWIANDEGLYRWARSEGVKV